MRNIRRAQTQGARRGGGGGGGNKNSIPLFRPIFDGSMAVKTQDDNDDNDDNEIDYDHEKKVQVSDSLLSTTSSSGSNVPLFLCGPLPPSKQNLRAWLFRNTSRANVHELPYPSEQLARRNEVDENDDVKRWKRMQDAYHVKRGELRDLAWKYELREAFVDRDDRLMPMGGNAEAGGGGGNDNDEVRQGVDPRGVGARAGGDGGGVNENRNHNAPGNPPPVPPQNNRVGNNVAGAVDNGNNNIPNIPPGVGGGGIFGGLFGPPELNEEDEAARRFMQNQENEAALAIDAAVRKYRREGVPENEFEFIKVIPRVDERQNLTARRIAIAIFCVLAAFVCIMIQTIQLFDSSVPVEPTFDQLLPYLLNVKYFGPHVRDCGSPQRDKIIHWTTNDGFWGKDKNHQRDCGDGVLHIPSVRILSLLDQEAKQLNKTLRDVYTPYIDGINTSWFHECSLKEETTSNCVLKRKVETSEAPDTCNASSPPLSCFRGVHDGIISEEEVSHMLDLAEILVSKGHSHITIHNNTEFLLDNMPLIMEKLEQLLYSYGVADIKPVAFQVNANLPVDMMATNYEQQTTETRRLYKTLNESIANEWVAQVHSMNSWSMLSLKRPFRDSCVLLSDLHASDSFAFRTSVSLSEGGGKDFSGAGTLYVDNHESNTDPGKKIQRGVVIDSSRGRVIVSSGGEDNLRCRMPMRSGVRVELHIWWDCT